MLKNKSEIKVRQFIFENKNIKLKMIFLKMKKYFKKQNKL